MANGNGKNGNGTNGNGKGAHNGNGNGKHKPPKVRKLSARQRLFINEYLKDPNGTQAAIRAGYSPRTANEQASQLLAKVSISTEIEKRMSRYEISANRVLQELSFLGFANLKDYEEAIDEGTMQVLTRAEAAGLVEWSRDKDGGTRIKIDKIRALELLGKSKPLKLFSEQLEVSGLESLAERIERARNYTPPDVAGSTAEAH